MEGMDGVTITVGAGALVAIGVVLTKLIEMLIVRMREPKTTAPSVVLPAPGGNGKVSKEVCNERWNAVSMQFVNLNGDIKEIKEEQKEQRQDIKKIHETVLTIAQRS